MCVIGRRCMSPSATGAVGPGSGAGGVDLVGRRECSPLPSALRRSLLVIGKNLFCELNVGLRTLGTGVVEENRFAVTGCFRESNTAWDDGPEDFVLEELPKIRRY